MKDKSILSSIGIIIFFILTAVDKFILELSDVLYIIIGLLTIILIIIGFTSDKKKGSSKKNIKNIVLAFIITILLTVIYINPLYIYRNTKLSNNIEELLSKDTFQTKDLIPYDFDKYYIIMPYTAKEDIEKEVGIKSRYIKDNMVNDGKQQILVIKDNKVIACIYNDNYNIQRLSKKEYFSSKDDTFFQVTNDNGYYYLIETLKSKEETFYNISFNIPGEYWREDIDEPGRMYYLDIESPNNLHITKIEDFSMKKYKTSISKELEIVEEKEEVINNINAYYLLLKQDDKYINIRYIITINEETYVFNIYCNKEKTTKYQKELKDIISSISIID